MEIIICPNDLCKQVRCKRHCNHCGKDIIWRPPGLDPEIAYNGPWPLNPDGSLHRCMQGGTKDGKFYYTGERWMVKFYKWGYPD